MTLRQKQSLFATLFARLVLKAIELGYEVTLGELQRPQEMADIYAERGTGSAGSLHILKLAGDVNLFRDGRYLSSTESHRELGEWWEAQHELCRWGGRFGDGNHYSFAHGGRA
jgi:hypothetical protein